MPKLHELREQRAGKVAEMRQMVETAEREKRDLSDNERQRFDVLKGEVSGIEARIGQAETLAEFERRTDAEPITPHGDRAALEARYSLGKALSEFASTGRLTGAEAEFAAENRSGQRPGGFSAPTSLFLGGERRAVLTTAPSAGPGGNLVATNLGPLIDRPRPTLAVQRLGATVLNGLTDNLDLPRLKSSGVVGWVGEHQEGPQDDPTFDKVSMGPKTVTGSYEISRRMMIQAPQIEQILRADLGFLLAQALDLAAAFGTGTGSSPQGIVNTPGVPNVSFAGSSHRGIYAKTAQMIGLVDTANLASGTGFYTSPKLKAALMPVLDGDGLPIGYQRFFHGEPVEFSTQVPANGGDATDLTRLVYGAWADLLIGYWSSVDIVLNPYADSVAKKGGAYLHAFLDADVAVRHVESFVSGTDVPTSFA